LAELLPKVKNHTKVFIEYRLLTVTNGNSEKYNPLNGKGEFVTRLFKDKDDPISPYRLSGELSEGNSFVANLNIKPSGRGATHWKLREKCN
jgi:hypothetical protein